MPIANAGDSFASLGTSLSNLMKVCHCGHKGQKVLLIKSTRLFKSICYDNKFDIKLKGFNNGKKSIAHLVNLKMLFFLVKHGRIGNVLNAKYAKKHIFGKKKLINTIKKNIGSIFG